MIIFVAQQLEVSPAWYSPTMHSGIRPVGEHAVELQQHLRLRNFRASRLAGLSAGDANAAWATDHGEPIVHALVHEPEGVDCSPRQIC